MKFTKSTETYLKEIFRISQEEDCVRSIDVASRLKVTKASVNRAVKRLSEEGYLNHRPYGLIFLTDEGRKKAQELCLRQEIIAKYLMKTLSLDKRTAFEEAYKIEHVIGDEIVERMEEILECN